MGARREAKLQRTDRRKVRRRQVRCRAACTYRKTSEAGPRRNCTTRSPMQAGPPAGSAHSHRARKIPPLPSYVEYGLAYPRDFQIFLDSAEVSIITSYKYAG